ncbi:hypothetical protein QVD17_19588 [Tagetes erecta]|uniref:Uncharacterized protein n=1 Tax=Tagetes erecta TaxID=13708 RepID=A0AAD8NWL6_TARER|nr:hypothetical protein QVD17_19588 [Tagetes erecta]
MPVFSCKVHIRASSNKSKTKTLPIAPKRRQRRLADVLNADEDNFFSFEEAVDQLSQNSQRLILHLPISDKPPNYVPLPDEGREKLCSVECLELLEHYRKDKSSINDATSDDSSSYGFNNLGFIKWQKEMQRQKAETQMQSPRNQCSSQPRKSARSQVAEKIITKGKDKSSINDATSDDLSSYGFNNLGFIKWQKEMQRQKAKTQMQSPRNQSSSQSRISASKQNLKSK